MRRRSHNREVTLNPRRYGRANDAVRKPGHRDPDVYTEEAQLMREYAKFARDWNRQARRRRQARTSERRRPAEG
jgi:hypothetical protein